jgi:chromosome segregation ATPase
MDQERQFALDNVARLEDKVRQRDAELAASAERIKQREADAEVLREEMSGMKRTHARVVDEQTRQLAETAATAGEAQTQLEALVRERAEREAERAALGEEVERLRRQVQVLKQESADKEVRIVQIGKQRQQDLEDMQGLNIALDSKQQELELVSLAFLLGVATILMACSSNEK